MCDHARTPESYHCEVLIMASNGDKDDGKDNTNG